MVSCASNTKNLLVKNAKSIETTHENVAAPADDTAEFSIAAMTAEKLWVSTPEKSVNASLSPKCET